MELPTGWKWKTDLEWDNVLACATDGECDVWVDLDGDVNIEGPSAPGLVVALVLLTSETLTFTVEKVSHRG